MRKLFLFIMTALFSVSLFAQPNWKADPAHSKITFTTVHLGIADVAGWFEKFDVQITSHKDDFSDAIFYLNIDVASINTAIEMRDDHLRSEDFFHVEQYPQLTFKSNHIRKSGKDKYKLTGELTLHGVTKTVTMDLWYRGTIENPQSGATTAGFQLTGTLKRSDFNVGPKFPAPMISDEVQIKADGEFIKK
ncbi:MAG TPA: YceI family protein [Chitinophagaceae bacterium]|nr:YceI family protein [Chitinophagaceae bacterium]